MLLSPKSPLSMRRAHKFRLSVAHTGAASLARLTSTKCSLTAPFSKPRRQISVICSLGIVGKWRSGFLQARLELYDEPRPRSRRKVSDEQGEQVVIQTLERTPRGQMHWSTRELAKATELSRMTISRMPGRKARERRDRGRARSSTTYRLCGMIRRWQQAPHTLCASARPMPTFEFFGVAPCDAKDSSAGMRPERRFKRRNLRGPQSHMIGSVENAVAKPLLKLSARLEARKGWSHNQHV